jgi:DNA-directed RNA polymerase specialized sigma24 family protein
LPVRERDTLICRYYLDLSVAGTAEVLGCPDNTVKTLTRRGLELLRLSYGLGKEVTDEH